jgi:hypothetical protein
MRRLLAVLITLCAFAAPATADTKASAKPACVVTRINLANIQGIRTIINGWDQCTAAKHWFMVEWFVDPNVKTSCRRDVGDEGPAGTRKTYMAYLAYDVCAIISQGYEAPWTGVAKAFATESRVSTNLMTTYQP